MCPCVRFAPQSWKIRYWEKKSCSGVHGIYTFDIQKKKKNRNFDFCPPCGPLCLGAVLTARSLNEYASVLPLCYTPPCVVVRSGRLNIHLKAYGKIAVNCTLLLALLNADIRSKCIKLRRKLREIICGYFYDFNVGQILLPEFCYGSVRQDDMDATDPDPRLCLNVP